MQIGEKKDYKIDNQLTAYWVTADAPMSHEVLEITSNGMEYPNINTFLLKKFFNPKISTEAVKVVSKKSGTYFQLYCPFCHKVEPMVKFFVPKNNSNMGKKVLSYLNKKYEDWLFIFNRYYYKDTTHSLENLIEFVEDEAPYDRREMSWPTKLEIIKTVTRRIEEWEEQYYETTTHCIEESKVYRAKMVCPHCGKEITHLPTKRLSHISRQGNIIFHTATLFNDEKKVDISILCSTVYINHKVKKISFEPFRVRFVFNTETGQSYFLPPRQLNNKKVTWAKYVRIKNITYSGLICVEEIYKNFIKDMPMLLKDTFECLAKRDFAKNADLRTFLSSQYRAEKTVLDEDFYFKITDDLELSDVTIFNRMPFLPRGFLTNSECYYPHNIRANNNMKKLLRRVRRESEFSEIVPQIIEQNNLPNTKKMRKLLTRDFYVAEKYSCFKKTGFTDINIFYSMLEDNYPVGALSEYKRNNRSCKNFIRKLIKIKGEPATYKAIITDSQKVVSAYKTYRSYSIDYRFSDTISMYYRICDYMKENGEVFDIAKIMKGTIHEIHDEFSKIINHIRYANLPLKYTEEDQKFNQTFDGYTFELAVDTNELVNIGQNMKICVGGYRDKALERRCLIVKMIKDGKYVGCIELDGTGKRLVQAKAVCNNLLQEYKAMALKKWIETLEIETENCWDYSHIESDSISFDSAENYRKTHDYHHLELDENGNVFY